MRAGRPGLQSVPPVKRLARDVAANAHFEACAAALNPQLVASPQLGDEFRRGAQLLAELTIQRQQAYQRFRESLGLERR
jgi:hypothetical protein